jgi:glycosyltransferase involved in cell wall biosynthesis
MKIALLTDGVHPCVIGGIQKHSFYLAKFFAANRTTVYLFHTGPDNARTELPEHFTKEEQAFISFIYIPFPKLDPFPGHYLRESYAYSGLIHERFIAEKLDADFIYAQGFCGWKFVEEKSKGAVLAPVGVHLHGLEMFQKPASFRSRLELFLLRKPALFNLRHADFVFSLGGRLSTILKERGIAAAKIMEIPLGIDSSWIPQEIGEGENAAVRRFVFLGRYERRKGIQELNIALERMKDQLFEMTFIGPVPEQFRLKSSKVRYLGSISDSMKIREILRSCDVLVCPSHSEGMPNVIVEAMACGLAVIATDVGAVSMLVSADTGLLIGEADPALIEKAMMELIAMSDEALKNKKQRAQALIRNEFTWDRIIERTLETIAQIVKQEKH